MTTETQQPNTDQQQLPNQQAANPAPEIDKTATVDVQAHNAPSAIPIPEDDIDFIERKKLLEEIEREKAAATAPKPAEQPQADDQQTAATPPPAGQAQKPTVMIPKAVFDERLKKLNTDKAELLAQNVYMKGQLDALHALATKGEGGTKQEQQAPQTPEQMLADIEKRIVTLAEKFDDGELRMSEYKQQELALLNQRDEIRDQLRAPANVSPAMNGETPEMQAHLDRMMQTHPYLSVIESLPEQQAMSAIDRLETMALSALGLKKGNLSPQQIIEVREEAARLSDIYGERLTGIKLGSQQPGTAQPQQQAPGMTQKQAANNRKIDAAMTAPPDMSAIGRTPATHDKPLTDSDASKMSEEEIAKYMPAAARAKLLGLDT